MTDDFEKKAGMAGEVVSELTPEEAERAKEIMEQIMRVRTAIERVEGKAKWLDSRLLDPIIGLFGELFHTIGLGDAITSLGALWIIKEALDAGLPARKIMRMLANLGFDIAIDAIPILGGIVDFFWKANEKNVEIMREYAERLKREHAKITKQPDTA